IKEMCGMNTMDEIHLGTDGCGVPVFGMPIRQLALAYAHLGAPVKLSSKRAEACNRIRNCITKHPFYLAGTGRFDTRLIEVTQGRIIGKMGAEGIFALTVPEKSLGMVIKIDDGSQRAVYPVVVEALVQLNLLSSSELNQLAPFHIPLIHNWNGLPVGRIQPLVQLNF
ncbi:MAG TPA: asparaginase, partial [Bacilli bacterium]